MQGQHKIAFETVAAAAEATTVTELGAFALPHLASWSGARHGLLVRIEGATLDITFSLSDIDRFGNGEYAEHYKDVDPVMAAELASPEPVARTSRLVDYAAYRKTDMYHHVYADNDISTLLMCRIAADPERSAMTALVLMRAAGDHDFRDCDEALCRRVRPALSAAFRRIERVERATRVARLLEDMLSESDPRARVVFDREGRTVWASRSAADLLDGRIPRDLRALEATPPAGGAGDVTRRVRFEHGSRPVWGTLYWRGTGGDPLGVVVLDDLSQTPPRLRALAAGAGLTPAETAVLTAIAIGMSTRRIAASRFTSIHTVYTQVKHVLAKFGVGSRDELLALLDAGTSTGGHEV